MQTLLNVLWFVFGGLLTAAGYFVGGLLLCATIVGIPFGLQAFKLARFALLPFGRTAERDPGVSVGTLGVVMNVLWLLTAGVPLALAHLGHAVGLAVTIIGLPFAWQHIKLAECALTPFGRSVRAL